ncbi:MAG TPA: hypothetical protein VFB38_08970 [Chthonomonadaceae bacterium]|nr:hypothetical protein [Chthonomonadaceae bacterium]
MPDNKPLQIAMIGLSAFGLRCIRALRAMHGVEIAWCCDLDEAEKRPLKRRTIDERDFQRERRAYSQ